jgi:hypothetical protein
MPTTIRHIKGSDLPSNILQEANISPDRLVTLTIEEEEEVRDLKQELREALQEVKDYRAGKIELQTYDDFVKELEHEA